jgi:hypothetical protein
MHQEPAEFLFDNLVFDATGHRLYLIGVMVFAIFIAAHEVWVPWMKHQWRRLRKKSPDTLPNDDRPDH